MPDCVAGGRRHALAICPIWAKITLCVCVLSEVGGIIMIINIGSCSGAMAFLKQQLGCSAHVWAEQNRVKRERLVCSSWAHLRLVGVGLKKRLRSRKGERKKVHLIRPRPWTILLQTHDALATFVRSLSLFLHPPIDICVQSSSRSLEVGSIELSRSLSGPLERPHKHQQAAC